MVSFMHRESIPHLEGGGGGNSIRKSYKSCHSVLDTYQLVQDQFGCMGI